MTSPVQPAQQTQQTQQTEHVRRRTGKEYLTPSQRFGAVVSLLISALIIGYFLRLWAIDAGFFTSAFERPEQFWLFAPMLLGLAAPTVRLLVGRRNPARPFEIITDVFMVVGAIRLLRVFPFDFSHLGDALPGSLPALLNWIPNWLGKVGFALQLVGGVIALIVTRVQFIKVSLSIQVVVDLARSRPRIAEGILFSGLQVKGAFDFVERVIRLHKCGVGYALTLVTDQYPPFRLAAWTST